MATVEYTIPFLTKPDVRLGKRLPPEQLGYLLIDLPRAVSNAVAMAVMNRSHPKGRRHAWLRQAADIRYLGHSNGDQGALHFEAPQLGDAAPKLFEQKLLFRDLMPDPQVTGFDLFYHVLADIDRGSDDSPNFDPALLRRVHKMGRIFRRGPFIGFKFADHHQQDLPPVNLSANVAAAANTMIGRTPAPQRIRLVGQLDGIEASTQRFSLVLDSGDRIMGTYGDDQADEMRQLWSKRVLVLGSAIYRASGRLLRIEAEQLLSGEQEPALFSQLPKPRHEKLDTARLRQPQGTRSGMAAIAGAWPGDENDAEIAAALEQIS